MKLVVLLVLVAACGKKEDAAGGTCPPLSVTVDGTPLPALPKGLAKSNNMAGDVSYEVQLFNHDKVTCEDLLNKAGRPIADGEISVRAFAAGKGMTGKGIAIDSHTQMGGPVTLQGDAPKVVGDVVKVCVDDASFKPIAGQFKDQRVVVNGLFQGTYCGALKW